MTNSELPALLEVRDLCIDFQDGERTVRVVDSVSFSIAPGEVLALVGESGCGKTVTALSIARLLPVTRARYTSGAVLVDGRDVLRLSERALLGIRGGVVSYVFQEPAAALNPVQRVGTQILEMLRLHRPMDATREEVVRLLRQVRIPAPEERIRNYPHQLSGGMLQRVMIAMAIAGQPKLLIADEPTTALDATIQAQILDLLGDLKHQFGMSLLLISHNLALVRDIADRVAVMYAGQIVEQAPAAALLGQPWHPYTRALLGSVPRLGTSVERLAAIPGNVPRPAAFPAGCRFHPRCPKAQPACREAMPALEEVKPGRRVRCPLWAAAPPLGPAG